MSKIKDTGYCWFAVLALVILLVFVLASCGGAGLDEVEAYNVDEQEQGQESQASGPEARIMEIHSVDGPDIHISRGTPDVVAARSGARLHDGYVVTTGYESMCHIRMDTDSLVRMDSTSRISVNRATATTLSIAVEEGQILVDVQNQHTGHDMQVHVGNFVLGVRGTLFVAGNGQVIMLEGIAYVDDDVPVSAGYVMALMDDLPLTPYPISLEELDAFAVQAILDYSERVLEAGAVTEEDLEWLRWRIQTPNYILIQGVQISTWNTSLTITSTESLHVPENAYILNLTDEDMEQLAYMINLTELRLYNQQITNLSPLAGLTGLTTLFVQGSHHVLPGVVSDISPLAGLVNLTNLGMQVNQISDVSPLAGLTDLRWLDLQANQISDISPVAGLTNLGLLALTNNQVSDISPVAGLINLVNLPLGYNQISDISPLVGLTNLRSLDLTDSFVSDISPLAGLTNLSHANLCGNQISDISPLAGLTNFTSLGLRDNQISDISPLAGLTELTRLDLNRNQIRDISPLAGLTNLTNRLWLDDNPITDWSPVAHIADVRGRP